MERYIFKIEGSELVGRAGRIEKSAEIVKYAHRFNELTQSFSNPPDLCCPEILPHEMAFVLSVGREFEASELEEIAGLGLNVSPYDSERAA